MKTGQAAIAAAVLASLTAAASAGMPFPHAGTPQPQDAGALSLARGNGTMTVTVALKLRQTDELERLVRDLHTPGHASFHRFLTPAQFQERFAPSRDTVDQAIAHFHQAGLSATLEAGSLLRVTGSTTAMEKAFNVQLHAFDVAAHGKSGGYRFRAPVGEPSVSSAAVASKVEAIIGLDDRPRFRPHLRKPVIAQASNAMARALRAPSAGAGNDPGNWTVTDLARYYNVQPLYDKGVHGEGRTIGIITFASMTPSDAFSYWNSLGLATNPKRLKIVDVDGGPGAPSDDSGSDETTLDVEQSGGIAPAAKVIIYQAPNTDQGFIDAFVKAINDNTADSLSVSWGIWEWFDTQSQVKVPGKKNTVDALHAYNNLFLQAAVQGQSLFAASGDDGAYDVNNAGIAPVPDFSKTLSVDSPASSPWITAAGGTTLPGDQLYSGGTVTISIPHERVWGWDYLTDLCASLGYDPVACGIFPAGGGGGVSAYVPMPFYQEWVSGTRRTEPGQTLTDNTTTPPSAVVALPGGFRGRNVPDVSLNADPNTGYIVAYTSDATGFGISNYFGGTSFVAPQLNGITALLAQRVKGRIGLLNVPLYAIAATPFAYGNPYAPLRDIKSGNNWFYKGRPGYDQGSGVGTLDVDNLAQALLLLGY
ncbi:S53 family peptidase [Piscinibacter terrae]|nr:S53 family serine peptidase [Albitalea terrae]